MEAIDLAFDLLTLGVVFDHALAAGHHVGFGLLDRVLVPAGFGLSEGLFGLLVLSLQLTRTLLHVLQRILIALEELMFLGVDAIELGEFLHLDLALFVRKGGKPHHEEEDLVFDG